jgi:phosphate-selective porin OprO/OprP
MPLTAPPAEPQAMTAPALLEPAPKGEAEEKPLAGYDKGFFLRSADDMFRLEIGARVQARFTYEGIEDESDEVNFMIRRARITLKGHAFTEDLGYRIQLGFDKGEIPTLKDAIVDYRVVDGVLHVRAGQYKKPFSRQQITSSGKLEMVDRSITDKAYHTGRDIGVTLHNDYEKSPVVEYGVGVYNGSGDELVFTAPGDGTNVPAFFDPLLVARVGYNFGKLKGYSEIDFEGGEPRFGVAANVQTRLNADEDDDSFIVVGGDTIVKLYGFSTSAAIFADWAQTGGLYRDQEFQSMGLHAQASYLIADLVAPAFRYARVMPEGADDDSQEITGGLGVYPFKHNFKIQADGGALLHDDPAGSTTDALVRLQVQVEI